MKKPLFEPEDFKAYLAGHETVWESEESDKFEMVEREVVAARVANAKLAFFGIDAATPDRLSQQRDMIEHLQQRLAELERQFAEAPVAYGWTVGIHQLWEVIAVPTSANTHRARLVQIEEIKDGKDNK